MGNNAPEGGNRHAPALDGIRIVECAQDIAAPYAAMLLAEQGAEVIKVEPPGGDRARVLPGFYVWNRSKRSVVLDLTTERGRAALQGMCAEADALISDWSPAATPIDVSELDRSLIHCAMPAYGSQGPLAEAPPDDDLVAARSTLFSNQWGRRDGPVYLTIPIASYGAAMLAAGALCAALLARQRDGKGQRIEVSWLAGALAMQTGTVIDHPALQRVMTMVRDPLGPIPVYRLFRASDGWLFLACGNSVFWNKLCLLLERSEMVSDPRFDGAPWAVSPEHWPELKQLVQSVIETRPRDEWLRRFGEADIPCAPVLTREDFIGDVQVREMGMMREIVDPELGRTLQMGVPVHLRDTPGVIRGPAPVTSAQASAFGPRPSTMPTNGVPRGSNQTFGVGPLAGTLVLDFTSYIAGPSACTALALAGADVLKIEPAHGDPFRVFGFGFYGWNQGKRGVALDFSKPAAREIVYDLVGKADVLVENLRPGATRRLGIDYETVRTLNQRLVYGSLTAFGPGGPRGHEAGFDPLLQARSGLMAAQGGRGAEPVFLACAVSDYASGLLCAFGVIAALLARNRTGRGQLVETSLAQAALAVQSGEFIFYEGRPDLENGGADLLGRHPLRRAYQCRDGWMVVAANAQSWKNINRQGSGRVLDALRSVPAFEEVEKQSVDGPLGERLAYAFRERAREDALAELQALGIAAAPVHTLTELFTDAQTIANELVCTGKAARWGEFQQTGVLVKYGATPVAIRGSAPQLGEHGREILSTVLGYSADRIEHLERAGVLVVPEA